MLHKSMVQLATMHRSIESLNIRIERSTAAVSESKRLLARLRRDGF